MTFTLFVILVDEIWIDNMEEARVLDDAIAKASNYLAVKGYGYGVSVRKYQQGRMEIFESRSLTPELAIIKAPSCLSSLKLSSPCANCYPEIPSVTPSDPWVGLLCAYVISLYHNPSLWG